MILFEERNDKKYVINKSCFLYKIHGFFNENIAPNRLIHYGWFPCFCHT